jgi:PAS domain S-box-containing protein
MNGYMMAKRLQRSIILYAALGIVFISIIISLVSIVPFYTDLKEDAQQNLSLNVKNRILAIDEYLARIKNIASQITSRTRIRQELEAYNRGEIDREALVEFSAPKLADALDQAPEIAGMVRFDQHHEPVVVLDMPVPHNDWPSVPREYTTTTVVSNPIYLDNQIFLFVMAPIISDAGYVGTDMVLFDITRLQDIVEDKTGLSENSQAHLWTLHAGKARILFDSQTKNPGTTPPANQTIATLVQQAMEQGASLYEPHGEEHEILAYSPLEEAPWALVIQEPTEMLYADANKTIGTIVSAVLALLIVGTLGLMYLLRPLAGRMILHTDDLEQQISEQTNALHKELRERIRAAEEVEHLRYYNELILRTAGEGIFGLDAEGNTNLVNPSALRMLGYTEDELMGKPHHAMVHHSYADGSPYPRELCPINQTIKDGGARRIDDQIFWRKDGTSFPVECMINPILEEGKLVGAVVTFQDITVRKQSEEYLRQARDAAEEAARTKSEFLANMSHEIRTPLNAVVGMTTLLLGTEMSHEQQDFVETIRTSGNALLEIINDILDFSKIDAGKMELEEYPFDLRICIEESLEMVAPRAAEKQLDLVYHIEDPTISNIIGDMARLRQVLVNLLNNAVKFTESGEVSVFVAARRIRAEELSQEGQEAARGSGDDEPATVDMQRTPAADIDASVEGTTTQKYPTLKEQDGQKETRPTEQDRAQKAEVSRLCELQIAVRDTGIGIPQDRMNRLFHSFSQADSSMTRRFGGTGLGLAISRRLVEMMGGEMKVESEVGKGSTFSFTILVKAAEKQPDVYLHHTQPQLTGKRALIVDDNATNRFVLARQLQLWGMATYEASSGPEALRLMGEQSFFDVAILDLHMPEMDGLTLAARIQRNPVAERSGPPLILMPSMEPGRDAIKEAGITFVSCLTKPVKPAVLHKTLLQIFSEGIPASQPRKKLEIDPEMAKRYPLSILIAEDNLVNQKVAVRLLERMGYHADLANNGREVLKALEERDYDVVFMDVQMPEMDGLETTRHIRTILSDKRQPRITAMTAHALEGDRERCMEVGMDDYISKPIQIGDLIGALERAVEAVKR